MSEQEEKGSDPGSPGTESSGTESSGTGPTEEPVSVEPLSIDQARRRLVAELARCLPTEEHVVAFLLELQPIRGSWELVEMARHAGQEIDKFWQLGVLEWLGRDEEGERLAELNRILRVLVSYEGDAVEGAPTGPSTEED